MLTPKVVETVRLSPHRRPAPRPRPIPSTVGAGGRRRHGGPPAAH
jgi:hypothetical protein